MGRRLSTTGAEPPVCALCSGRHWFLVACGAGDQPAAVGKLGPLAATATPDEIERALKLYRKKREQARDRMRKKRAAIPG